MITTAAVSSARPGATAEQQEGGDGLAVRASQPWVRRAAKGAGVSGLNPKALRCSGAAMIAIGALLLAEHLLT